MAESERITLKKRIQIGLIILELLDTDEQHILSPVEAFWALEEKYIELFGKESNNIPLTMGVPVQTVTENKNCLPLINMCGTPYPVRGVKIENVVGGSNHYRHI